MADVCVEGIHRLPLHVTTFASASICCGLFFMTDPLKFRYILHRLVSTLISLETDSAKSCLLHEVCPLDPVFEPELILRVYREAFSCRYEESKSVIVLK